ncbi:MAG TPA: ribosomal protein S18-alanine N-acetyltransferase, partial [Candidatus Methanoperedens sp.]|nr:ribosomal protein S18-alanine N-acetyltransferase [Candidatus Methanoperedens sp.]
CSFRRAGAGDVGRIMEIERDGFLHPWSRDLIERELEHAWSQVLLACEAGPSGTERVLGYIVFWLVHDEIHVLNVATAREARRRGVGRALMAEAEEAGRSRGARLSTLEVRRSNAPAIALYLALGYRQAGVRPSYYAEEKEDAIVMVKML